METPVLKRISEHVYLYPPDSRTDRPSLGVIAGKCSTLLVDAGNSPAHARLSLGEMERLCIPEPKYIVLTHRHWDHHFGATAYDGLVFAQEQTTQAIQRMAQLEKILENLRGEQGYDLTPDHVVIADAFLSGISQL